MSNDPKDFNFNFKPPDATTAYERGQQLGNKIESNILGQLPVFLIVVAIFTAVAEASFVAWLLPEMPWGTLKMCAITLTAVGIALFLPSRVSFIVQALGKLGALSKRVKNKEVEKDYSNKISGKVWSYVFKNIFIVGFGGAAVVAIHSYMIQFMMSAFSNRLHMEKLGIYDSAYSYMSLGIALPVIAGLVHLFLGFLTRIRVSMTEFIPDYNEELFLLKGEEDYVKFQMMSLKATKSNLELKKQWLTEQVKLEKQIQDLQNQIAHQQKQQGGSGSGSGSGSGGSGGGSGSGGGGGGYNLPKGFDETVVPAALNMGPLSHKAVAHKFFSEVTDKWVSESDFQNFTNRMNRQSLHTVGTEIADIQRTLIDLYEEAKSKWNTDKERIWKAICKQKMRFKELYEKNK